jgi:polyribonucleotide nucleotidyltransferase
MESKKFSMEVNGKELSIETGVLAKQAGGAVTVRYGETVILATATMSQNKASGIDYFPLMVEYEERYYAGGKIKGSRFIKREGRPSDDAVLNARLIDRTIRPLFDERMRNEVQIVITVLSIDQKNSPNILAIIGASLALGISNIPWGGPVAAVKVGKNDEDLIINPENGQLEKSPVHLVVSGTEDKINMLEAGANEFPEKEMAQAITFGFDEIVKINKFQKEIIKELGQEKTKVELTTPSEEFTKEVRDLLEENKLAEAFYSKDKKEKENKMAEIKEKMEKWLMEKCSEEELEKRKAEADLIYENYLNEVLHKKVLESDLRPDGRGLDDVRDVSCQVGLLPRTHGSGLFNRGETQALTAATLGAPGAEQLIENMETEEKKRYMHHYNFPPFCVGEVRFMRGPGRREIGHGALAEKALFPMIPSKEDFPYTIRLVSEVLSSNGSSSMASTCGSTLALMDAGVPIKKPVSGIAMGIIIGEKGEHKILSDIQGPEDHWGDMDFKVAGTKDGITALQMDVKIDGITPDIVDEVLDRAYKSRMEIMEKMLATIPEPRTSLSSHAPSVEAISINPEKIKDVIGPGGKMINKIIDETNSEIDIEDDGTVFVTAENQEDGQKAKDWIKDLTREVQAGELFKGKVVKIADFGAFVEVLPGKDGLVHISEMTEERLEKVTDLLKLGQIVNVKVKEIDSQGRINLTAKGLNSF